MQTLFIINRLNRVAKDLIVSFPAPPWTYVGHSIPDTLGFWYES